MWLLSPARKERCPRTGEGDEFSTEVRSPSFPDNHVGYSPDMDFLGLLSTNCSICLGRLEEFPTFTWCDRCEIEVDFEFASFQVKGPK